MDPGIQNNLVECEKHPLPYEESSVQTFEALLKTPVSTASFRIPYTECIFVGVVNRSLIHYSRHPNSKKSTVTLRLCRLLKFSIVDFQIVQLKMGFGIAFI